MEQSVSHEGKTNVHGESQHAFLSTETPFSQGTTSGFLSSCVWQHMGTYSFYFLKGILCSQPGQARVKGEVTYGSRPVGQCASITAECIAKIWGLGGSQPDTWGV